MTDDRLERLRQSCEGKKDIKLPALELLNLIDMVQNYGTEIDRLYERLAAAENSLDEYRKVIWMLVHTTHHGGWSGWVILDGIPELQGIDIAAMQKGMGK